MKNFLVSLLVSFLLIFSIQTTGAALSKISGYIFDKNTGKPIPDANVIISNTNFGAASRDGGFYFIKGIPQGQYDIVVKVIGYNQETMKSVQIAENTMINFSLTPAAIEFDPIIVTATLSDHRLSQVSIASEVLTQPRLLQKTGTTVGEAMVSVGGVYLNSYDGIAGPHIVSIRGSNADQVVVLLDGLRLNTAQGGGVDLNLIPVSAIEKIEVVRGGHSALMGSDAIGGAIQLLSKETIGLKSFSYGINTGVGSFGTKTLSLNGSHKIGVLSYFIDFNRTQSDGDFSYLKPDQTSKQTRENNDYKGNNLFVKTNLDLSPNNKINILFHHLATEKGNAGSVNINSWTGLPMLTPNARAESTRRLFAIKSENQITGRFRLEGQTYYQTYDYHYIDPDGWAPVDDKHENAAMGLNLQGHLNINSHIDLIGGAELRQDRLTSTKVEAKDRNSQGLYLQAELRAPMSLLGVKLLGTVIPAVRWDNYSDVASQVSPKIGGLVTVGDETSMSLRGNLGKSYRVPTFDDLYWPDEGWGRGNPDLKPETSANFDIGLVLGHKSSSFSQLEINYFNNTIEDLISWGSDNLGIWMPLNIGKAKIAGIETGAKFRLPNDITYLEVFHTWLKATDETPNSATEGKRLIYRPTSKLDLQIGSAIKRFSINLNYRLVSNRYILADNSSSLSDYNLFNGNISYSIPMAGFVMDAKLQVLNLFDKSIYIYDGYPLPGREMRFSVGINY
ncbi:TonB-dependent receptor [candidate division KSB1 bacterium]|nr:TonB-dependent receptor [candidate division KSB1 bacterium]